MSRRGLSSAVERPHCGWRICAPRITPASSARASFRCNGR